MKTSVIEFFDDGPVVHHQDQGHRTVGYMQKVGRLDEMDLFGAESRLFQERIGIGVLAPADDGDDRSAREVAPLAEHHQFPGRHPAEIAFEAVEADHVVAFQHGVGEQPALDRFTEHGFVDHVAGRVGIVTPVIRRRSDQYGRQRHDDRCGEPPRFATDAERLYPGSRD